LRFVEFGRGVVESRGGGAAIRRSDGAIVERNSRGHGGSALEISAAACVIDQDAAHHLGCRSEEMRTIPAFHPDAGEAAVRLSHECGGL
jgi:hypothetical protein